MNSEDGAAGERIARLSVADQAADVVPAACSKCGEIEAAFNGLCTSCFRFNLFGKFKLVVTSNAMISPTDNVLVAFSGGPASRVALQLVHEMHSKALKSWDLSRSQALPVFGLGVALSPSSSHEIDKVIGEVKSIVSELTSPLKELHIVPIESIFSLGSKDGVGRLNELIGAITDVTGKEDFLRWEIPVVLPLRDCLEQELRMLCHFDSLKTQ